MKESLKKTTELVRKANPNIKLKQREERRETTPEGQVNVAKIVQYRTGIGWNSRICQGEWHQRGRIRRSNVSPTRRHRPGKLEIC